MEEERRRTMRDDDETVDGDDERRYQCEWQYHGGGELHDERIIGKTNFGDVSMLCGRRAVAPKLFRQLFIFFSLRPAHFLNMPFIFFS
jgi:hypothetical protein